MVQFLFSKALAEESAEQAVQAAPGWFKAAFEKLGEFPTWGWVLVAALLVCGVAAWRMAKGRERVVWTTRMVALGAVCMALSSVLSMIRLYRMPMGGSVTPASMLPVLLFAYLYGAVPGVTLGVLYGLMQFVLGGGSMVGVVPMLLDYPIAFGVLGLCGLCRGIKNERVGLLTGVAVGSFARFLASFLSGWVFYGEYCSYYGFESPILYSICYNGAFLLPDCLICMLVAGLLGVRLIRELRKVK